MAIEKPTEQMKELAGKRAAESVRAETLALMRSRGPKLETVLLRLRQGLDAKETKFFQKDGIVQETRDVVAHGVRLNAAKMALDLYDAFPAARHELEMSGGGVVFEFVEDKKAKGKK